LFRIYYIAANVGIVIPTLAALFQSSPYACAYSAFSQRCVFQVNHRYFMIDHLELSTLKTSCPKISSC